MFLLPPWRYSHFEALPLRLQPNLYLYSSDGRPTHRPLALSSFSILRESLISGIHSVTSVAKQLIETVQHCIHHDSDGVRLLIVPQFDFCSLTNRQSPNSNSEVDILPVVRHTRVTLT